VGQHRLSPRGELLLNRARRVARLGRQEMGALKIAPRPASDSPGRPFTRFMFARTKQQRNLLEAIAYHEAGYLVAASVAQVPIRKPRNIVGGLRRCASHILDLDAITEPEDIYAAALVMLAGAAALRRYDASANGSDEVEASVLLFNGFFARFGGGLTPADVRSRMRLRCAELAAQAESLVAERWCEIQGEAARLLGAPALLVGAPVRFRLILLALDLHRLVVARAVRRQYERRGRVIEAVAKRLLAWTFPVSTPQWAWELFRGPGARSGLGTVARDVWRVADRAMSLLPGTVTRGVLVIARRRGRGRSGLIALGLGAQEQE
jgi:hypothetical protein